MTQAFYEERVEEVISSYSFLHKTASVHLLELEAYYKNVRKHIGIQSQIPIYFSPRLFLFYIRDNEGNKYWINYAALRSYQCFQNRCLFIFLNGISLPILMTRVRFKRILTKIEKLIDYINNI